jgi:acyl-CoA thioesterase I
VHLSLKPFLEALRSGVAQRAVMFGDSITFGSQIDPAFDHDIVFHRQWHEALLVQMPAARLEIVNRGLPGNKITHALERVDRDVIAEAPNLIVVEFGINDCWDGPAAEDSYEQGLHELVETLRSRTRAALILLTANMMNHSVTPEALQSAWFAEKSAHAQRSGWMLAYMDRMRRIACNMDIPLADGYARWEAARARGVDTDTLLANRANHPNREGHRLLAEALLAVFDL